MRKKWVLTGLPALKIYFLVQHARASREGCVINGELRLFLSCNNGEMIDSMPALSILPRGGCSTSWDLLDMDR